jgi:hypothetical protein
MNRFASAIVALLVALAGVLAISTPAEAAALAPARQMTAKLVQPGGVGKPIYIQGTVQNYPNGNVLIQHRNCSKASCTWSQFKTIKTNANRFYKTRVGAPKHGKWFWRAVVKPSGAFGFSAKNAPGYTYQV